MDKKKKFYFKGLMAPVFTPFNNDETMSLNCEVIHKYVKYLRNSGITGVLVNGTTGEGMSMTVKERKTALEAWHAHCFKVGITVMVQIGGAAFTDVVELAKHATKLKVDAILCLPELYFKPKSEEDLVDYLVNISQYCGNIPFLYYHIPMFTNLNLNMPHFSNIAEKLITNFAGIKYTSGDLVEGIECLKSNRSIFLGADTILAGALVLGFDSAIMTSLNIYPEISLQIIECIKMGDNAKALILQKKLNAHIHNILMKGNWVKAMKMAFNEVSQFGVGDVRKPL